MYKYAFLKSPDGEDDGISCRSFSKKNHKL